MKGLSEKEIRIVAFLEFNKKYFFNASEIESFCKDKIQRYNLIKNLLKKGRIVKLNKTRYYLVPIKAETGTWAEHPFVLIDEICNGEGYAIGGWSAANYWHLTEQVPMMEEVYATKKQGIKNVLNTKIVFHRTSRKIVERAIIKKIQNHEFKILPKKETKKWMKSRRYL